MASPFVYFADDRLSTAELTAARLDGHVIELGEAWIPADAVETAALRAASLAGLLGETLAATHASAAWVHGARAEPPARHSARRATERRLHQVRDPRLRYRDGMLPARDRVRIGPVLVTSRVRTLIDLLREGDGADDAASIEALLRHDPALAYAALDWLDSAGAVPGKRVAVLRLRERAAASGQDDVTR